MHICSRLNVPQVRLRDIHNELCIRTFFSLFFISCPYPIGQLCDILYFVSGQLRQPQVHIADLSKFSNFNRRQSAAIELFTAAATFSVLIHLLSQVRGGISQDSGRVLTRTLGEYFSGGDPVSLSQIDHHGPSLTYTSATPTSRASPTRTSDHPRPC